MSVIGITLDVADARLQLYLAAEAAVLDGQSYRLADRELTRADLKEIREGVAYWNGHIDRLNPVARITGRARRGCYRGR